MKKYAIILLLGMTAIFMSNQLKDDSKDLIENKTLYKILNNSQKLIEKKYNLSFRGNGISGPGKELQELFLSFNTKDICSNNELTRITLCAAEILLNEMNNNPDIQTYLDNNNPFTIKNVDIVVYNFDSNKRHLMHPQISTVEISDGVLTYRSYENDENYKLVNQFEETYEQAKKRVGLP